MVRVVVLHLIAAALLTIAYVNGGLSILWEADRFYAIPIIGSLTLLSLWYVSKSSLEDAVWLADKLPVIGLALTVIGLVWAVKDGYSDSLIKDATHSLVGNLMGVVCYAWIELCVWTRSRV